MRMFGVCINSACYVLPFVGILFTLGCTSGDACVGGECFTQADCISECEEACEGDVLNAFCDLEETLCECECEFGCFL